MRVIINFLWAHWVAFFHVFCRMSILYAYLFRFTSLDDHKRPTSCSDSGNFLYPIVYFLVGPQVEGKSYWNSVGPQDLLQEHAFLFSNKISFRLASVSVAFRFYDFILVGSMTCLLVLQFCLKRWIWTYKYNGRVWAMTIFLTLSLPAIHFFITIRSKDFTLAYEHFRTLDNSVSHFNLVSCVRLFRVNIFVFSKETLRPVTV